MKRIHFSVGPNVQISSVHRLRRPFHTWPVPPRWAVSLLCVALIFTVPSFRADRAGVPVCRQRRSSEAHS